MLKSVYAALTESLGALDAPVFQADCVPQGQPFPYVTLTASLPMSPAGNGVLILDCWCCGGCAHSDRLTLAEAVLALIPPGGLPLDCPQGRIVLRGDGDIRCLQSGEALGVRLRWALHFFPICKGGAS